jgi:NAD(P)-dependent dehydrogenase (short-subunit alcohol dehydrogenase family)
MNDRFTDKVALVTGGNSGIGLATSLQFAREGAKVAICARRKDEGENAVQQIKEAGGEAVFIKTDVSKHGDIQAMVARTIETYGKLDYAFNNAGVSHAASMHELTEEEWDYVMNINLKGVWLCMKYQIPHILKTGGAIVNMSSGYGLKAAAFGNSAYTASKHGVIGLTKTAALEYATRGIRVNCIVPGWILTPMVQQGIDNAPGLEEYVLGESPLGRLGTPEEMAEAVIWMCSDAASYVNGHTMIADGGLQIG